MAELSDTDRQMLLEAVDHYQAGRLADAERLLRRVLSVAPEDFDTVHLLGLVRHGQGDDRQAIEILSRAAELLPDNADVWVNLAEAHRAAGEIAEAEPLLRRGLALDPAHLMGHNNLSVVLHKLGRNDEASAQVQWTLRRAPNFDQAWNNLGMIRLALGDPDAAVEAFRRACELAPESIYLPGGVLFTMLTHPAVELEEIAEAHRQWGLRMMQDLPAPAPHTNDRDPDRRLRIGYVSPDFRTHVVPATFCP